MIEIIDKPITHLNVHGGVSHEHSDQKRSAFCVRTGVHIPETRVDLRHFLATNVRVVDELKGNSISLDVLLVFELDELTI